MASGLIRHQQLIYYPMLAYNSYLPDSSELVITNLAECDESDLDHNTKIMRRKRRTFVLNLGQTWSFVSFINTACQSKELDTLVTNSQIFFLAYHKTLQKYRVLMLDHDPWRKNEIFKLKVIASDFIKAIPNALDEIKCIHMLTQKVFLLNAESHN